MLSKEKFDKNSKKYYETGEKYGFLNSELIELLGPEFMGAPSATSEKFGCAYEGGLIQHLLNTTKYAVSINGLLPENKKVEQASLIKVCCLHQIGKAKMFVKTTEKWKIDKGMEYEWADNMLSMSTDERSVYYAMKCGIDLSEDEAYAIHNYDADFTQKPIKSEGEKLAAILRVANLMATIEEKNI